MSSPAFVRWAVAEDLPGVLGLERATPEAPHWNAAVYGDYAVEALASLRRRVLFVAVVRACVSGFAAASVFADEAELESMAVAECARRAGLGTALLAAVMAWAHEHGARTLLLEVRSANASARAFYESQGFFSQGRRRDYYTAPVDDAVLMRLDLPLKQAGHPGEL